MLKERLQRQVEGKTEWTADEKFKRFLFDQAIFQKSPRGQIICDLEAVKSLNTQDIWKNIGDNRFDWRLYLLDLMQDRPVYSKEDYEKLEQGEEVLPKQLFYSPKTADEAFNVDYIRKQRFYLTWRDVSKSGQDTIQIRDVFDTRGIPFPAADVAMRVFHPDYGDAEYDKNGALRVWNESRTKKNILSATWIYERAIQTRMKDGSWIWADAKKALSHPDYEILQKRGIITPVSFAGSRKHVSEQGLMETSRNVSKIGLAYVEGWQYSLGRAFAGHTVKMIGTGRYGIFAPNGEMTHWFDSVDELTKSQIIEQRRQQGKSVAKGSLTMPKEAIAIQPADQLPSDNPVVESKADQRHSRLTAVVDSFGRAYLGESILLLGKPYIGKQLIELSPQVYGVEDPHTSMGGLSQIIKVHPVRYQEKLGEQAIRVATSGHRKYVILKQGQDFEITQFHGSIDAHRKPNENLNDYAERLQAIKDMSAWHKASQKLTDRSGIVLRLLPIHEQAALIDYSQDPEQEKIVIDLSRNYGSDGLRVLAREIISNKSTDRLVRLLLSVRPEQSKRLIKAYAGILHQVDRLEKDLSQRIPIEDKSFVVEKLVSRANRMIDEFSSETQRKAHDRQLVSSIIDQKLQELEAVKADVLLFANTITYAMRDGSVDFQSMKDVDVRERSVSELTATEKKEYLSFFRRSRKSYEDPKVLEKDLQVFKKALDEGDTTKLVDLRIGKELVAFMRFDRLADGSLHAGSLNASPDAAGSGVGMAFLKAALEENAKEHVVNAEVALRPALIDSYVNRLGFELYGLEEDVVGGDHSLLMRKVPQPQKQKGSRPTPLVADFSSKKGKADALQSLKRSFALGLIVRSIKRDASSSDHITFFLSE